MNVLISERMAQRASGAGLSGETGSDAERIHLAGMLARTGQVAERRGLMPEPGGFPGFGPETRPAVSVARLLRLDDRLRLAIDEVVHHNNVMTRVVVRPGRNVASRNPNRHDASVIKLDAEKGEVPLTRRGCNGTAK